MKLQFNLLIIALTLVSCSDHLKGPPRHEVGIAVAPASIQGNGLDKAGPVLPVSGGANTLGVIVPTARASIGRIENALERRAPASAGNFLAAITAVRTNLPRVANPLEASGFDQVQILAYAACSDLTRGNNPVMQSVYNIQPGQSITANQAALIAAGVRILDQNAAGLAAGSSASAQVTTVLTNLVQAQAANAGNNSTMAFMAVCIAATTAGATLLGI